MTVVCAREAQDCTQVPCVLNRRRETERELFSCLRFSRLFLFNETLWGVLRCSNSPVGVLRSVHVLHADVRRDADQPDPDAIAVHLEPVDRVEHVKRVEK